MFSYKRVSNIVGWTVFALATAVYYLSAERTGNLWDCGEFILGAYKLPVVTTRGAFVFAAWPDVCLGCGSGFR